MSINTHQIRQEFPIFRNQPDLVYLDSAATSQKPDAVLDAMHSYYSESNANVHRGMHRLAEAATIAYENARSTVRNFVNANEDAEIIFTKSGTEAINLVARSWGKAHLKENDTVVLSVLEHHSNVVPWLQLKDEIGINVEWVDIADDGTLKLESLDLLLATRNVKLVSVTGLSNVLGVAPPLEVIAQKAHEAGARVCVDAAQLIAHRAIDVQALDCDFLAFSGHKVFGPTGVGVLYGKRELLDAMPPFLGGGMMIGEVKRDHFTCAPIPQKFEAGTPPIAEAIGLAAALDWFSAFSWEDIEAHEQQLLQLASEELTKIDGLTILGTDQLKTKNYQLKTHHGCLSFIMKRLHPHDLTDIIGREGMCLRAGHHCTQPLHDHFGIMASTRLSVSLYNTIEEIGKVKDAIIEVQEKMFVPTV